MEECENSNCVQGRGGVDGSCTLAANIGKQQQLGWEAFSLLQGCLR